MAKRNDPYVQDWNPTHEGRTRQVYRTPTGRNEAQPARVPESRRIVFTDDKASPSGVTVTDEDQAYWYYVNTPVVQVLQISTTVASPPNRQWELLIAPASIEIENCSAGENLWVTFDGSDPIVGALFPGATGTLKPTLILRPGDKRKWGGNGSILRIPGISGFDQALPGTTLYLVTLASDGSPCEAMITMEFTKLGAVQA